MLNVQDTTAKLATLSDQQLQQFANDHKHDAFSLALAMGENGRRSAMRASAQQQSMPMEQPSVVDQAIASMAPTPDMADTGIAAIAPDDVAEFAEGGIVAFAGGGETSRDRYIKMIRDEAKRQGMDPDLAVRMFATESNFDPDAVSPKGATGLAQLMKPAAEEMGLRPEERTDPEKAIPAGIGYFMKQQKQFGSPEKAAAAYNWGPGNLSNALKQSGGVLDGVGLPKETAKYLTKLFPASTAQAEEVPSEPIDVDGLSSLTKAFSKSPAGPAKPAPKEADWRVEGPGQSRPPLGSRVEDYQRPDVKGHLATKGYSPTAFPPVDASSVGPQEAEPNIDSEIMTTEASNRAQAAKRMAELPKEDKAALIAQAEEAIPEEQRKGWSKDQLLAFFLSLAAGESPYAATNIGKAGLAGLAYGKQEREEARAEEDAKLMRDYRKAYAEYLRAGGSRSGASALTQKDLASLADKAADNIEAALKTDTQLRIQISRDPAAKARMIEAEFNRLKQAAAGGVAADTMEGFKLLGSRPAQ